jgi:hypothetical protein
MSFSIDELVSSLRGLDKQKYMIVFSHKFPDKMPLYDRIRLHFDTGYEKFLGFTVAYSEIKPDWIIVRKTFQSTSVI